MNKAQTARKGLELPRNSGAPETRERFVYLCPTRYFHCFMYYDRKSSRSCWLPAGFMR